LYVTVAAERRVEQADRRAQTAIERADRVEAQASEDRNQSEGELAGQRAARQAADLEQGRAQAGHAVEQRLSAELEKALEAAQGPLDAAEGARGTRSRRSSGPS
jgi:hypothetical protein